MNTWNIEKLAEFVRDNAAALDTLPSQVAQGLRDLSVRLAEDAKHAEREAAETREDGEGGYWDSVRSIAADCVSEAIADNEDDGDDARDDASERAWESVDGSQWIIYTRRNYTVLQATSNDDAWQEFGELDPSKAIAQMAFSAMLADVRDEIRDTFDAAWEAHEDAKEQAAEAEDGQDEQDEDDDDDGQDVQVVQVGYIVRNRTDGIDAFPAPFATREEAEQACDAFRARFASQGCYKTGSGERIAPADIDLLVEEAAPDADEDEE